MTTHATHLNQHDAQGIEYLRFSGDMIDELEADDKDRAHELARERSLERCERALYLETRSPSRLTPKVA